MLRLSKKIVGLGIAAALTTGLGMLAYGGTSSVIEKVSVTFKAAYGEPEEIPEPEITVTGTGCTKGDVQYRTDYGNWRPGSKVRVEITVFADYGKYFPVSLNRSQCTVSGADFVSAKALDDATLQVKVDYRPIMTLGDVQKAGWSNASKKTAVWKTVPHAPGYTVTLYGDDKVVKRMNVEANNIDFSPYMKDLDLTYYYEVKAIPITSDQKKYLKEGSYITSTDQVFELQDFEEEQKKNMSSGDGGSIKGDNYIMPDGSKAVNTWKLVTGNWYYFDGNGTMGRGWQSIGGRWYYMDQNGVMRTGWVDINNGSWFYLNPNGEMQTGWIQFGPGCWYYLNPSGYMERYWITVNDKMYYLGQDGKMQTGWTNYNEKWYYLSSDGSMAVNTTVDGWYIGADGTASR